MDFFEEMPSLGRRDLMNLRKGIDAGFRSFSRSYGEALENFFDPLLQFLIFFEKLLIATPWPIILLIVAGLTWLGSRSWKIVVGSLLCFMLIGYLGMWEDTMSTVAMISVATLICISIGIPNRGVDVALRSCTSHDHSSFGRDANDPQFCLPDSSGDAVGHW